jgi:hypothetical protein
MNSLWLTYASACLALHGLRVDASWAPDEIQAAWCALARPGVDFQHWLLSMRVTTTPAAASSNNDAFIQEWNTKSDELNTPPESPQPPTDAGAPGAEWKTLDPIALKGEPDTRAVFDSWADAGHENAYVLVAGASGYGRRLMSRDAIGGV